MKCQLRPEPQFLKKRASIKHPAGQVGSFNSFYVIVKNISYHSNSGEDKRRNFAEPETNSNAPYFGTVKSAI